jgi:hypothetical protein
VLRGSVLVWGAIGALCSWEQRSKRTCSGKDTNLSASYWNQLLMIFETEHREYLNGGQPFRWGAA